MLRVFDPDVLVQHIEPEALSFPLLVRVHVDNMTLEQRGHLWPLVLDNERRLMERTDYVPGEATPLYVLVVGWRNDGGHKVARVAARAADPDADPIWLSWAALSPDLTILPN